MIDHTADVGMDVFGKDLERLFSNAAVAMFHQITVVEALKGDHRERISVKGLDLPDLMINWLRELLYLWAGEARLIQAAEIVSLSSTGLVADIRFDTYTPTRHTIKGEIKAVTYHQVAVQSVPGGWQARIIFDV